MTASIRHLGCDGALATHRRMSEQKGYMGKIGIKTGASQSRCLTGLLLLIFCILFFLSPGFCGETATSKKGHDEVEPSSGEAKGGGNPGTWLASFFRDHISAVDGDRCPSSPSCSSYSLQAFQKHGFFVGWVMTVDRLIHEGDEPKVSPMVRQNGKYYVFDPVANNDFWWYNSETSTDK